MANNREILSYAVSNVPNLISNTFCFALHAFPYEMVYMYFSLIYVIIDFGSNDRLATIIPYILFAINCDVRLRWNFCTPGK
jgi:hypothetical protein